MAKDSPRTTAGELQKIVETQKTLKELSNSLYITTCCLGGFQKNKKKQRKCFHPKTNSSIFSYQTQQELQMRLASMFR